MIKLTHQKINFHGSLQAQTYGQGTQLSKDRFEMFVGVKIFFYDMQSIGEEFGNTGLFEVTEAIENYPFYLIKCGKRNEREKEQRSANSGLA